jgi:zinc/manganese transport system ATP-binding protein
LIRAAIEEELRRGVTVIESTHDAKDIERADRVITLNRGRISSDTRQTQPGAAARL